MTPNIHLRLKEVRKRRRLTQTQAAKRCSMSPAQYSRLERGESRLHLDQVPILAVALEIPPLHLAAHLLFGRDPEP